MDARQKQSLLATHRVANSHVYKDETIHWLHSTGKPKPGGTFCQLTFQLTISFGGPALNATAK